MVLSNTAELSTIYKTLPGQPNVSGGGGRKILKGNPVPPGWYVFRRGTIYDYIKPLSEVAELRGGQKQQWLRIHGAEVVDYYSQHGETATLNRFCLKSETLQAVLKGGRHTPFVSRFTRLDKLELLVESYHQDVLDLRAEVKELRETFSQFQTEVASQMMKKLLLPLIQNAINFESEVSGDKEELLIGGRK
jgi:hypothetical protein